MRQCQPGERWYGLWDFPRYPFSAIDSRPRLQAAIQRDCGLFLVLGEDKFSLRHAVTRFRIELTCISGKVLGGRLRRGSGFRWIPIDQMGQLPLNSTGRKIAERIGLFLS
jgi:A/G-specific adenine glycosylase